MRRRGFEAVFLGIVVGMVTVLASAYTVPELSGAAGGLAATVAFLGLRWRRLRGLGVPIRALSPYAFLLTLLLLANGLDRLRKLAEGIGPAFVGPGLPLLISCAFAAVLFRLKGPDLGAALVGYFRQWPSTGGGVPPVVLAGAVGA